MKYKRIYRIVYIFTFIFTLTLLFLHRPSMIANADYEEDEDTNPDESKYTIKDSKGEVVSTITMRDGIISVVTKSKTGTNKIRWSTIGFTITKKPLKKMNYTYVAQEGKYYLEGYENVSTVYDSGFAEIEFRENEKSSETDPKTGYTTAYITVPAKRVEDELGESFENITKDTIIYLHGIFRVYEIDSNGKEKLIETGIKNWKDILLAHWWDRKDGKLNEFAKFFNMPIKYKPRKQDVKLNHYIDGVRDPISSKDLEKQLPGEYATWSNQPAQQTHDNKLYELYKYEIVKSNGEVMESHYIGDSHGCKLTNIKPGI